MPRPRWCWMNGIRTAGVSGKSGLAAPSHRRHYSSGAGSMICRWMILALLAIATAYGQIHSAAYERALASRARFQNLITNESGPVTWLADSTRFWYRKTVPGGHEFVLVDTGELTRKPAFDHEKLAAAVSTATGEKCPAITQIGR